MEYYLQPLCRAEQGVCVDGKAKEDRKLNPAVEGGMACGASGGGPSGVEVWFDATAF